MRLAPPPVLALLSLAACHAGAVTRASNDPVPADGAPPAAPLGDASFGGAAIPSDDGAAHCAEDIHTAAPVPLDLMLLIDRSSSMQGTKWQRTVKALSAFVSDPRSDGLGVGLQFFPIDDASHACRGDADCGSPADPRVPSSCGERWICVGAMTDLSRARPCGTSGAAACAMGETCLPLGRCAQSNAFCATIDKLCPGGLDGDVCRAVGNACREADFSESCSGDLYRDPAIRVGTLPVARAGLVEALAGIDPGGGTPMMPAVKGSLGYLAAHLGANRGHRAAVVLVTDGIPSPCGLTASGAVDAVAADLHAASTGTPAVPTYVIGMFAPGEDGPAAADAFAAAGGTGKAHVLAPTDDLAETLLATLAQIRGAALPCELTIPPATHGALDYGQVNVHFTGAAGAEDVPYVGTAARCDAARGGWYYDVDPARATPTRVLMCPRTCARFAADPGGQVQVGYGCKTHLIE